MEKALCCVGLRWWWVGCHFPPLCLCHLHKASSSTWWCSVVGPELCLPCESEESPILMELGLNPIVKPPIIHWGHWNRWSEDSAIVDKSRVAKRAIHVPVLHGYECGTCLALLFLQWQSSTFPCCSPKSSELWLLPVIFHDISLLIT